MSMRKKIIISLLIIFLLAICTFSIINHKRIILYLQHHEIISYNYDKTTDRIPILTYHSVIPDKDKDKYFPKDNTYVSESFFKETMQYLHDNNYKTLTMNELYDWYKGNKEYNRKTVVITFDDGRVDNYYYALPILKEYNINATIFVIGSFIKETSKPYEPDKFSIFGQDLIDDITNNYPNIELQSHSYALHSKKGNKHHIKDLSKEELIEDFKKEKELFGYEFMAYPYGVFTDDAIEAARENNYKLAFRFHPSEYARRTDNQYAINRIKISGLYTLYDIKRWLMY